MLSKIAQFAKRLLRLLASGRLAMTLLLAWAGLLVVWVVPFIFYGLPLTQIQNIVTEEISFRIVYVAMAIATIACVFVRMFGVLSSVQRLPKQDGAAPFASDRAISLNGLTVEEAGPKLAALGYRRQVQGDGWLWAVRNRFSPVGTLLLHVAVIVGLIAAYVALQPDSLFMGEQVLAQGEIFHAGEDPYTEVLTPGATSPDVTFTLVEATPKFYRDLLLFTHLECVLMDENSAVHPVSLSSPWIPSPSTMVAISDFGYTISAASVGPTSAPNPEPNIYKLKIFPSNVVDSFEIESADLTTDYRVYVSVYGDYVKRNGKDGTKSYNLANPVMEVSISRLLLDRSEKPVLTKKLVRPGERIQVGPTHTIAFGDVGYYAILRVTRSDYAWIALLAVVLGSAGVITRLLLPRREVVVSGADDGAALDAKDRTYGNGERLANRIVERLEGRE